MKNDNHIFSGLQRDLSISKNRPEFLWDAHNIRITTRGEETLLSLTNERGPAKINTVGVEEGLLNGKYLGHCTLNNYLVVFTKDNGSDYIYRVKMLEGECEVKALYSGNLNFDLENPIEALGVYENESIQKVYWVDNRNQPRVINIMRDYRDSPSTVFDFVHELKLEETVTVTTITGGYFASGVIQYAFSYYNKYGGESNIFYTTGLHSIANTSRGGSSEELINVAFQIDINGVDANFEYLRVYSIHRTSIDATPTVKIITDIAIGEERSVQYVDTGVNGSTVDPTELLYIGGESIKAGTLTQKDNTLFMGNISVLRGGIPKEIKNAFRENGNISITTNSRIVDLGESDPDSFYNYINQAGTGKNVSSFKNGNTYRLGVQLQYKTGKWSEPIYIKDFTVSGSRPSTSEYTIEDEKKRLKLYLCKLDVNIPNNLLSSLEGYKKIRGVIVHPSTYDKKVLAQGVLCPTVFSINNRISNTPFAQSSWFFRPMTDNMNNAVNINSGASVSFKHFDSLLSGSDRGAEIQNMVGNPFYNSNSEVKRGDGDQINTFYVDQSILTFHSPDVEFDTNIRQALENGDLSLNIVGVTRFIANAGDISIQTSSGVPASGDTGFYHKSFFTLNRAAPSAPRGIVSGMFYKSHLIDEGTDANSYDPRYWKDANWELNWLIYPWHRSTSLNNDCVRPEGKGTTTSALKRKVISNIRIADDVSWLNGKYSFPMGITKVSIFDGDNDSLIRVPSPANSGIKAINYYGNIDTLIPTTKEYNLYTTPNKGQKLGNITVTPGEPFTQVPLFAVSSYKNNIGDFNTALVRPKDPVRMKYKSSPHAVFALNYSKSGAPYVLPMLSDLITGKLNEIEKNLINVVPFWNTSPTATVPDDVNIIDGSFFTRFPQSATSSQIENIIKAMLRSEYENSDEPILIISNCSTRPADSNWADLYEGYNPLNNEIWERVDLPNNNTLYKFNNELWSVGYNGTRRALRRVSEDDFYYIHQDVINMAPLKGSLFVAELVRTKDPINIFGGDSEEDLMNNLWLPAGEPVTINTGTGTTRVEFTYGDTYYQRYDCLKTYSYTPEDENSVIEIGSFMLETGVNIDGRYDRNRALVSNLNISNLNFNLLNPVYSQKDTFFNYRMQDEDYYRDVEYPTAITWSLQKQNASTIDNWAKVTLSNILYLDGKMGRVNSLTVNNSNILCFQDTGVSQILFNSRVQIPASDGVPVEISNNYKVDGYRYISNTIGCRNKWSIINAPTGIYFIDSISRGLYNIGANGLSSISATHGMSDWFSAQNNEEWSPSSWKGLKSYYDHKYNDLYIVSKEESLVYSELLGQFTSFMSYENTQAMDNIKSSLYALRDEENGCRIWNMFEGEYNYFFDQYKPFDITFISNAEEPLDKIFTNLELRADFERNGVIQHNTLFDYMQVSTEYQDTGEVPLSFKIALPSNLKKKFRIWRIQIPRDKNSKLDRIRNTWAKVKLGMNKNTGSNIGLSMTLHDISVQYLD